MKNLKYIFFIIVVSYFYSCTDFSKAKNDFLEDFDLELTGRVIDVKFNNYGQKLVCLDVIESNHQNYFPIHNPNKYLQQKDTWEKRFFIKVEGKHAVFIFDYEKKYTKINEGLKKGAIITINENKNKAFSVYSVKKEKDFGGLNIMTYPIRNNIKISCLRDD